MKNLRLPNKQNLENYSKPELISLLTNLEEQCQTKNERLRSISSKLSRARTVIQSQKQRLQHLRRRVVDLTPKSEANLIKAK